MIVGIIRPGMDTRMTDRGGSMTECILVDVASKFLCRISRRFTDTIQFALV